MRNFNSHVRKGYKGEQKIFGSYNYGAKNENGEGLVHFCPENNLKVFNIIKKRKGKHWTWLSPKEKTKNLAPRRQNITKDFNVLSNLNATQITSPSN